MRRGVGYSNVDIHAPFAGTVYAVPVAEYDFVKDGDDLVDVADLTQLQVHAYFDEPEVGKLAVGQPVKIVVGGQAEPGVAWPYYRGADDDHCVQHAQRGRVPDYGR